MNLAKIRRAVNKIAPSVKVENYRGCVRLTGELDNWTDIYKCGKAAVCKGSLGVVNDIRLKGFHEEPKKPTLKDDALSGQKPDVLIVGGGIVGCAVARELSRLKLDVLLVEKSNDVACGASSRNDGCIHPGIDLHKGQQKLKYVLEGNRMYTQLAKDLGLSFKRWAQMFIFSTGWENTIIPPLFLLKAKILGVEGVRYVGKEEIKKIEPNPPAWAKGGMYMASAGMVSPYKTTIALCDNAIQNGARVSLNTYVDGMDVKGDKVVCVHTNRGDIYPRAVVNCAGVYSDVIADMAGDRTFTIHPRKGIDVILDKKKGNLAHTSMSKMPFVHVPANWKETKGKEGLLKTLMKGKSLNETQKTHTKGGGVIHTVDNNVLLGPNAIEVPDREDFTTDMESIQDIVTKQKIIQDKLGMGDVITYFAGERPATYEEDFVVRRGIFTKNIIEVAGIQSPGITTAPAVAKDVEKWAIMFLGKQEKVKVNENYNPKHKSVPHLADMSEEERNELIKKNPAYGEIVCRCEEISKGEILDAVRSAVPVYTVDAIKRRVRPGMGRCQGGFCGPTVVKILAEEKGCSVEEITKGNDYSVILYNKTKKGAETNV